MKIFSVIFWDCNYCICLCLVSCFCSWFGGVGCGDKEILVCLILIMVIRDSWEECERINSIFRRLSEFTNSVIRYKLCTLIFFCTNMWLAVKCNVPPTSFVAFLVHFIIIVLSACSVYFVFIPRIFVLSFMEG